MEISQETSDHLKREEEVLSSGTRIPFYPLAIKEARDTVITDFGGNQILDFLSGACVINIGHNHPELIRRIKEQADTLIHYNSAYATHKTMVELAEKLTTITPGKFKKKVSFGLSGGDANDTAIKVARTYTNRNKVVAFFNSYHGTTYGAISLSAVTSAMRERMGPFLPEVYHIPFPDCYRCAFNCSYSNCSLECFEYFEQMIRTTVPADEIAAIFIEPIQGDSGILVPPKEYVSRLVEICKKHGILLVADEVQSGFGRTGKWFASEHIDLTPDIVVLGKAIASGMPLSAVVARSEIMESWRAPAGAFSTAANPVCCSSSLATVDIIEREGLIDNARNMGNYVMRFFEELKNRYQLIGDVRGRGLMIGVDLVKDRESKERAKIETAKVSWRCWEKGLFLTFFSESVLRIAPPLTIKEEQLNTALRIIEESIEEVTRGEIPDEAVEHVKGW